MTPDAPPAADPVAARSGWEQLPPLEGRRVGRSFTARQLWLLGGITVLAAVLRLWRLGDWSIWVDEAHTWRDVTMPLEGFLAEVRAWYPTSYLLLRWLLEAGWLQEFGEGWLRLPFAFCGIVTVPLLALLGNHLVGRRAALMAALFLAVNPWHVYWSQNARSYVLVCMFAVAAAGVFWLGVARRSRGLLVLAVVLALASASSHPTGLVLLPVFLSYPVLASRSPAGRRTIVALLVAGIGVTVLPSVLELLPPLRVFGDAKPGSSLVHLLQTTAFYFRLPLLCAAGVGIGLLFHMRLQGHVLFLACWALLPLLLLGIVGSAFMRVTARYGLCALPAVLLLAGVASVRVGEVLAAGMGRGPRLGRWLPAALLPGILTLDMVAYDYLYFAVQHGDRGRWREAREVVLRHAGGRPVAIRTTNEPSLLYYLQPNFYRAPDDVDRTRGAQVEGIVGWKAFDGGRNGSDYLRAAIGDSVAQGRALYVVASLPELTEIDVDGSLRRSLQRDFVLLEVLPCWVGPKDESIYVWAPPGPR